MASLLPGAVLLAALGAAQLLPPAGDGDIRTVHYERQNVTDIFLLLEPRTLKGERAPIVTFTGRFPGRRHTLAPRAELWFELDGREVVNLSAPLPNAPLLEGTPDYWSGRVPIDLLRRMARAQRINGSSLGFPFELSASQRQAIRAWLERITPQG